MTVKLVVKMAPPSALPCRSPLSPAETEPLDSDGESLCGQDQGKRKRPYPLPPPARQTTVLAEDLKTPDRHVERDPRLIRLTGAHPFNVEPPLTELFREGFLTTKNLHFVRNHGYVPEVKDDQVLDWELSIEGLVRYPVTLTLRQLLADYEQHTYPITLVCAGNRRKEQNLVRKTNGFSWGAAGLSTALWTGVPLRFLLERAQPQRGARFVRFQGADKLPKGHYDTSVRLSWARDPERGILVAHKMNGEALPPDHGRPLRVVIPGQIGGRSVKWLRRIIVTAEPSDSWYHIYDNRVLPTTISPEASANLPEVWRDERYAIYDLNTNSAICCPAHRERLRVAVENGNGHSTYTVRGYAYAGGGKRVTRAELSLDGGRSWRLAQIEYPEDSFRLAAEGETLYGGRIDVVSERETCFCWCFWSLEVAVADLQATNDILLRCMDDAMMVQPRDMYWNVLGMMNNPWFRVVVHKEDDQTLWFEHPAPPKASEQGWMERVKKADSGLEEEDKADGTENGGSKKAAEKEIHLIDKKKAARVILLEELRAHNNRQAPWFVVQGHVYDGTSFLDGHPGGASSIIGAAAQDVTEEFMTIHSENARLMMSDYHVGMLDETALAILGNGGNQEMFPLSETWSQAVLMDKKPVSTDSKIFSFCLPATSQRRWPIGQHFKVRLHDPKTGEAIVRAYTPFYEYHSEQGILNILVKIYRDAPGRPGGRMTQALDTLPLGDAVDIQGPVGCFAYLGGGWCAILEPDRRTVRRRRVRRFVMVCGGSGITAVLVMLRVVLEETDIQHGTQCLLLYGNRTETDILCRAELDKLAATHGDRFRVIHVLSQVNEADGWTGQRGRMDTALLEREVGRPSGENDDLALICGPRLMATSVQRILTDMQWRQEDIHVF